MSWIDGVRHRLRTIFHPAAYDHELDEEMELHLELDAMQQGDQLRAVRRFGNRAYYKEDARQMTLLGALDVLRQDLTYVWRTMMRSPGLTITIVATLALGIGVNAAVFTVLDRLYLRAPGGIEDPSTLRRYWVQHFRTSQPFTTPGLDYRMYRVIANASGDSANVALFTTDYSLRQGKHPRDPQIRGVYATANYFPVVGARPAHGRFFSPDEDRLGSGAPVAVISHDFWTNRLGADSAVLGQPLPIGSDVYTIIGVAETAFTGLDLQAVDVWIPLGTMPSPSWLEGPWWESPHINGFRAVQRLSPGIVESDMVARATQGMRALQRDVWAANADTQMNVYSGSIIEARGPGQAGQELIIATRLGGVAVIVLLIVCANVINLLLARAVRRRREIAVRLALGVSRGRLARLITTEALALAAIAGAAALLAAAWGGNLLRSLLMPDIEWTGSALDWRVAVFTVGVALMAGLAAGIIPAVQASSPDLSGALKSDSKQGVKHKSRLRRGLLITQAALSVMLLIGSTLFIRSLQNVQSLDIGFDSGRLLFGGVTFAEGEAPPGAVIGAAMREIAQRLQSRPGVEAVARAGMQPMQGFSVMQFYSGADSLGSFGSLLTYSAVSPSFFRAAGLRILQGQGFTGADVEGSPAELVVNESMAKLLWPGGEPIGQCIRFKTRDNPCYTVVGVVENARRGYVIEAAPEPQFYLPLGNMPTAGWSGETIILRTQHNATGAATAELRAALRQAFPAAEPTVTPMTENLEPEYRPWRLGATLFTTFGLLALLVTIIGVFSTVSYDVSQRTHEFGVRVALGARMGDVLRQVIGEGVRTIAMGIALGLMLALAAGRLIAALLYGIEPNDPLVMTGVAIMLLVVAGAATLAPAWRAARADPVIALRTD
jgi:predicted permease